MIKHVAAHIRHNVVAYIALFFALGGGAVAATTWSSRNIKDDSLKVVDLNFPVGADGGFAKNPVPLGKTPQTIAGATLNVNDGGGNAVAIATVQLTNDSGPDGASVQLRMFHVGHPEHTITYQETLPAGASRTVPVSIQCNGYSRGKQVIRVEAIGSPGTTVGQRSLSVLDVPPM